MSASGRKKDPIWLEFKCLPKETQKSDTDTSDTSDTGLKNKSIRVVCTRCNTDIVAQVDRMKKHIATQCTYSNEAKTKTDAEKQTNVDNIEVTSVATMSAVSIPAADHSATTSQITIEGNACEIIPVKKRKSAVTLDQFITKTKTSSKDKRLFDEQIARFFFSANITLNKIENAELKKFCEMVHPGYYPPTVDILKSTLLNQVYEAEQKKCLNKLSGHCVNLSIDGCSNTHLEPIVFAKITKDDGDIILMETVDTSKDGSDATFYTSLALKCISKAESAYNCKIGSIVIDYELDEFNMNRISKNILIYGCSANYLKLFATEIERIYKSMIMNVQELLNYFCKNDLAKSYYEAEGGGPLQIFGYQHECLKDTFKILTDYIKNWTVMMQVR